MSAVKKALQRIDELERENARLRRNDPIAVVGLSCRFPGGVGTPDDFWRLLAEGREAIGEVPPSRWRVGDFYDPDADAAGKTYTRAGGFLDDDVYAFDAAFFGIAPVEAIALDPQQRLLLELAWEAIEHAGIPADRLRATQTGVFVGISAADYAQARLRSGDPSRIGAYDVTGLIGSTAAGRIAYTFDLHGPAVAVDTACSSSLVAIDLACASLRDGTSDWALAAGVNVILTPEGHICFSKMRALSPDGHCRAFDAGANGFVRSEGGGMLLLRRLSDAVRDGNEIFAVIRGSAVNQDGRSNGMTAPNLLAQEAVVRAALARAGVAPHEIDLIEAHGTGTPLGDPIELEALANVFAGDRQRPLFVSSVKTNLGHLETAAGMASVVKVVLALRHHQIPPHLHLSSPTPHFDWSVPFRVPTQATPWERGDSPRRAGVSGFGFGGTNAHLILEEAPPAPAVPPLPQRDVDLLLLSAKSEASLAALAGVWRAWIVEHPDVPLSELCAASRVGRAHLPHRMAVVAATREELLEGLARGGMRGTAEPRPRLAFQFTGEGALARELYEREPVYRAAYDAGGDHGRAVAQLLRARGVEPAASPGAQGITFTLEIGAALSTVRAIATALAELHLHGVPIDWTLHGTPSRHLALPSYRFDRKRYIAFDPPSENTMTTAPAAAPDVEPIASRLDAIVREATGLESIARDANLLELGVDSLMLMQTRHQITQKFGVEIPISDFFERLTTLDRIAAYVAECGGNAGRLEAADEDHTDRTPLDSGSETACKAAAVEAPAGPVAAPAPPPAETPFVPYRQIQTAEEARDERQKAHLRDLVRDYCEVTAPSKEETQRHRLALANNRNVAGFRPSWKEMIYQVVAESADGARIRTRGGRELTDFTMGFGVHLFGHNAPFIREAIAKELASGFPLGPMYHLAGEVAEDFCALTGNERVAFYNSGTEAVMVALRIARTVTGKNRIVLFEGSYHGSFDGILALRAVRGGKLQTIPGAPGTTQGMVDDAIVLRYDDPRSIEIIREHAGELAAVLVEPVQSRRPDLRPRDFLHALREVTARHGIALIFDEVVTGFRCHPRGAQGFFEVRPDLSTYGKVVGGGMPIGLVAGKAEYMDAVDGGAWSYGDDSYPKKRNTFVAGTFCHHPLTLAAMRAVLARLKAEGPALQESLNRRTAAFCNRLNRFFEDEDVPIRMAYFGSLFRFLLRGDAELLFFHLIRRGFYIWEGRNCFLSTAHTDDDVERFYGAIVDSVQALRSGGVIPERTKEPVAAEERERRPMEFSLFFFSSANNVGDDKYRLLLEAARCADRNGYAAVWTPERHFHDFGGLYPNPAITGAALATITKNVRIRAGSTVLLLHDPVRFAENWSLVDNLSHGRVDVAMALGWNSNDFALAPDNFEERARIFPEYLDTVRRLWRGEKITRRGGKGEAVEVELHPRPVQRELPIWYVAAGNPDTFRLAGEQGGNLLTYLEGQTVDQLAEKLASYRAARRRNGHRGRGHVTLMLHTFIGDDLAEARATVAGPLKTYLRSSFFLRNQLLASLGISASMDGSEADPILDRALARYLETSSLIGTADSCLPMLRRLGEIGVDEIGCLIDFGVDFETTMRGLGSLTALMHRTREGETLPLTDEQKELWAAAQLEPGSTAYNEAVLLQIDGPLDSRRLRDAVAALAERHDALRVICIDGETQRIAPWVEPPFETAADESTLLEPFDLQNGPLFRVVLVRERQLYFVAHHVIANGWSLGLFVEELSALYANETLPPATPFREFLQWQASRRTVAPSVSAPPLDLAGPVIPAASREGGRHSFPIDGSLYRDLKRAAAQRGATLVMTMLAGFELLLARVSGQRRFLLGVPLAGQAEMGAPRLAGQCTTVMPLLCDLGDEWTLDDLVRDARRALLAMHATAGARIAAPRLAAMFNMDRAPSRTDFAGLPMTVLTAPIGDAKVDLFANVIDFGDRLVVELDYRRALLEDDVIRAWSDAYLRILTALAGEANTPIFALPICEPNDIHDARGLPVPPGVEGEWRDSGDLVRARGGRIEWTGRVDRNVTVGDRRVNLAFVESLLRRSAPDAVASVVDGELTATASSPIDFDALRGIAPPHLIPTVCEIDGVLHRQEMTPFERRLAEIWSTVLGFGVADPHDHFFHLGGQSLQAAQLVGRIREQLHVDIGLRELFDHPTLRALAQRIEGCATVAHESIPPAPPREDDPLSHAQRRLWLTQQLDPSMTAYNIPLAAWLDGPLDRERLQRAFDVVARRHAALRTEFVAVDGEPRQRVTATAPKLELIELPDEAAVLRELERDAAQPFALDRAPLVRARLLALPRRAALAIDLHHIIADGWSAGVLVRELAALYRGASEADLPPLPIQYRDFAEWQSQAVANDGEGRAWWLSRFAPGVPRLSLRTDAPRPMVRRYAGRRMRMLLEEELTIGIRALARTSGASVFVVLLAAVKALLHRLTGDEDIVAGVPVSGRGRPELDHQIGFFVNTLPLRDDVRGAMSFRELLHGVHRNALDAFAHGDYPLDLLVEHLDLPRDWSRTPLFDVVVTWDDVEGERFDFGDVHMTAIDVPQRTSLFDLVFHFTDQDGLRLDLDYDLALFQPETIALLQQRLAALLRGVLATPDLPIAAIELDTDSERSADGFRLEASFRL